MTSNGVALAETLEEFSWLSGHEGLGEIYCVSSVRDLAPEEVLRRFGVDESTMEEITFDELDERLVESMRDDAAGHIGAAKVGDWAMVIEPGGWQIAVDEDIMARVSRGTEVVSICRHNFASDAFAYIVDGAPVVWFDPMLPDARSGSDPDRLVEEMREVGLDPFVAAYNRQRLHRSLSHRATPRGDLQLTAQSPACRAPVSVAPIPVSATIASTFPASSPYADNWPWRAVWRGEEVSQAIAPA